MQPPSCVAKRTGYDHNDEDFAHIHFFGPA
jgi:hypothetical protein